MQFGVYTFFLTCSAAKFHWTEIIQVVARPYRERLTDKHVNAIVSSAKVNLKRNLVTVARQIDYVFKQFWGKVLLSGFHLTAQVLNFDDQRKFQNRGTKHMYAPVYVLDVSKIDKNEDNEVLKFINKHITSAPQDETIPWNKELCKEGVEPLSYNHLQKGKGCTM